MKDTPGRYSSGSETTFFIYETFKYKKRGEKEATEESICERVVRLATNIRNRQSKACKQGQDAIRDFIERYNQRGNKILFVNVTGLLDEA